LIAIVAKEQIDIVIEPIDQLENPTIYLASVTDGFDIVREVNSPNVKVLYDFYHEQRSFGNLIEKVEKNIGWIGLVHVADVPGRHEPGSNNPEHPTASAAWTFSCYASLEPPELPPRGSLAGGAWLGLLSK
jgi:hydroxypyruvate isomerase